MFLSTPKHNGKSGTEQNTSYVGRNCVWFSKNNCKRSKFLYHSEFIIIRAIPIFVESKNLEFHEY
jgi:hypothetical protein